MKTFKYIPTVSFAISNLLLLATAAVLFFGRTKEFLRFNFLQEHFTDFYQHISNFSISYMIMGGVGFLWLLLGVPFKFIVLMALAILIANFVYELWIPVLNTTDVEDAYYGMAGTVIAFLFLLLGKYFGIVKKPVINK